MKPADLSARRTELAIYRTDLALERTGLAYDRTVLSCLGIAVALVKVWSSSSTATKTAAALWVATAFSLKIAGGLAAGGTKTVSVVAFWAAHTLGSAALIATAVRVFI